MLDASNILAAGTPKTAEEPGKGNKKADGHNPEAALAVPFLEFFTGTISRSLTTKAGMDTGVDVVREQQTTAAAQSISGEERNNYREAANERVCADRRDQAEEAEAVKDSRTREAGRNDERPNQAANRADSARETKSENDSAARAESVPLAKGQKSAEGESGQAAKIAAQATAKGQGNLNAAPKAGIDTATAKMAKELNEVVAQAANKQKLKTAAAPSDTTAASVAKGKSPEISSSPLKEELPKPGLEKNAATVDSQKVNAKEQTTGSQNQNNEGSASGNATSQAQEIAAAASTAKGGATAKGFSMFLENAGGTAKQTGPTGPQGAHVSLNVASGNYTRAATGVVNTAKATATAQTTPAQVLSQIVRGVKVTMQSGKEEMKMLLKPEELGWLRVKVSVDGQKVTATFTAENEFVKGVLESNLSHLQQALQHQNMKITHISVEVNSQMNPDAGAADKGKQGSAGNHSAAHTLDTDMSGEDLVMIPELQNLSMSALDYCV